MMRRPLLLLLAACLSGPAAAVKPGEPAPDFSLPGTNGQVNLAALRGKFVYLDFWASWCAPCKRSFPWMATLQQRFGPAGLKVVAVNLDTSREDANRFLAATPAAFAVAFDPTGALAKQYAIPGMPTSVLIDPDGRVVHLHAGFTGDTPAQVESQLAQALQSYSQKGTR